MKYEALSITEDKPGWEENNFGMALFFRAISREHATILAKCRPTYPDDKMCKGTRGEEPRLLMITESMERY